MRLTALSQSGAPGRIIGWTNFSQWQIVHGFVKTVNVLLDSSYLYFACSKGC